MAAPLSSSEVINEILLGLELACLAITDSKPGTLQKVIKANPWHLEALKSITGSEERCHQPLRTILKEDMGGLLLDWEIDIGGITKGGHFLDTQGYIAHNDDIIVVSFRCTTSAFDWMTNLNTTSSAWELDEDLEQGFSGFCSGLDDLCCTGGVFKPRVHTGFYNNLLAALPIIKRHVDPLLKPYERPRKLYIVGHSLGAGIATLAGCYFMTEYHWTCMRQQLVIVTAGSPRAVCTSMKKVIDAKREEHGSKCRMYRVVKGTDMVTRVPPQLFGFCHLIDPVHITDSGSIVLRSTEKDAADEFMEFTEFQKSNDYLHVANYDYDDPNESNSEVELSPKSKYDRMISRVPKSLRDHMPDFYLNPVLQSLGLRYGSTSPEMRELRHLTRLDPVGQKDDAGDDKNKESSPKKVETSTEKFHRKTQVREPWVPRMFRSKKTAPTTALTRF